MWLHRLLRLIWILFAALVVSVAVALSAARLLLPSMSEYRVQLEAVAERFLERPVRIGSLDAAWQGLSPVLKLEQVSIEDEKLPGGRLDVGEVRVALDVIQSLIFRQWRTAGISIIGVDLELASGADRQERTPAAMSWLLRQKKFEIRDLQVQWSDPRLGDDPLLFEEVMIRLENDGDRHQFLVEAGLPTLLGTSIKIAGDFSGPSSEPANWRGRVYLETLDFELAAVQRWAPDLPVQAEGTLDLQFWAGVENRAIHWGSGSLTAYSLSINGSGIDSQAYRLDQLTGSFQWKQRDDGWQASVAGLEMERDRKTVWAPTDLQMTIEDADALRIHGTASQVQLGEAHAMLPLFPWIGEDALAMVDRVRLQGNLQDVDFELLFPDQGAPRFSGRARFESLQVDSGSGLPAISGMSGSVEGNLQSGSLYLDSQRASLALPTVFAEELDLEHLAGTVNWQRYRDSFRIESQRLRIESGELGMDVRMLLDWPYQAAAPWIDLQLAADVFPATQVRNYLPAKVMPAKAVKWLRRAFKAGTVENARFLLQGNLDRIPFDGGQGRLEARFDFRDMVLDYDPHWGQLDELGGSALFSGRSMEITGRSASLMDAPVERVVAVINDFKSPVLEIDGTVGGTLEGMLQYVEVSPLGERFGRIVRELDSAGDARLQLDLDIPLLARLGNIAVEGNVDLDGNELSASQEQVVLKNIHGRLHFTREGFDAQQVRASLFGHPVVVNVYPQGPDSRAQTVVDIQGALGLVERLRKDDSAIAPYISGKADWRALLRIPNRSQPGQPRFSVVLLSNLVGVSLGLPEPFRKTATESREFRVDWVPGQMSVFPIMVTFGDQVDARLLLNAGTETIRKAEVRFGKEIAGLPETDEIRLLGELQELDLSAWLSVLRTDDSGNGSLPPMVSDLDVNVFRMYGYEVPSIHISSEAQDPWFFLVGGEGAQGEVRWRHAVEERPAHLQVRLDHLITEATDADQSSSGEPGLSGPQALPGLDIRVDDLTWANKALGKVVLQGTHSGAGMQFESLNMESGAIVLDGSGEWLLRDGQQTSHFSGELKGGELGKLLKLFGDQGSVKGGELSGQLDLAWAGSPTEFELGSIEGELDLKVVDGRLEQVKEGAGKLLNLISLNSLQRRLTLDFSDLFKEGFSFDSMQGRFVLMDGDAFTDNFKIKGSSAMIDISGRTGLVGKDYDQLVTVTPEVSSSLPIAGVIAGGPAVGAAVLLAERLMGDRFNRMARVRYQVSGTWDEPVYRKLEKQKKAADSGDEGFPEEP